MLAFLFYLNNFSTLLLELKYEFGVFSELIPSCACSVSQPNTKRKKLQFTVTTSRGHCRPEVFSGKLCLWLHPVFHPHSLTKELIFHYRGLSVLLSLRLCVIPSSQSSVWHVLLKVITNAMFLNSFLKRDWLCGTGWTCSFSTHCRRQR